MTEALPSDVMNQPMTADQAKSQLAALAEDPKFKERTDARDATAFAEVTRLGRIARNMPPEPVAAINAMDVMTETVGRQLEDVQRRADSLRADGFTPTQIYAVLNDAPVSLAQRQYHEREVQVLKSNADFVRRYLAGDLAARAEMRRHHVGLRLPVGTPEQIDAWARAHAGKQPV